MRCSKCNSENPNNALFCGKCGEKFVPPVKNKTPKTKKKDVSDSPLIDKTETEKDKKIDTSPPKRLVTLSIIVGVVILGILFSVSEYGFLGKEKKAIKIVQKSKISLGFFGLEQGTTWLDWANILAKKDPNKKYKWSASKTQEKDVYLVSFRDEKGWGSSWEVTIPQQIVKTISGNEYLGRKYGLSRLDTDGNFEITDIKTNTLTIEETYSYYSRSSSKEIGYILEANVFNRTNKMLTNADISGTLKLIFKDTTVESPGYGDFKGHYYISTSHPWEPNTGKNFYVKVTNIEEIYLKYVPEYVIFEVNVKAGDPIGFSYDKNIAEYDLKDRWATLGEPKQQSTTENKNNYTTETKGQVEKRQDDEVIEACKSDVTKMRVALGLYEIDYATYAVCGGSTRDYEAFKAAIVDKNGNAYMFLPSTLNFDPVSFRFTGDSDNFTITVNARDNNNTIIMGTPDKTFQPND